MSAERRGRVVFFGPGFHEVGGAQKRARLLTSGLARSGWTVRAVNRAGTRHRFATAKEERLFALDVPGLGLRRLGALFYVLVGFLLGLSWGIRSSVLVAMQVGSQTLVASVVGALLRKPFVVLGTSSGMLSELAILREGRGSRIRRWAIRRAAFVIVQTEGAASELEGVVGSGRIGVLPNPVEPVAPVPLDGAPRALFMGRLSEEKDLPNLISAWRAVAAGRPGARLTLLGEGGHFRSVEPLLRATISGDPLLRETVAMKGWVADPLPDLLASDVFVFPSLSEGMSNSLLEACAAGRVVVASAISSNIAVLGEDYPLLFPPGDCHQLESMLVDAFDDHDKRRAALETVAARLRAFSPDRVLRLLEGVLFDAQDRARDFNP